MFSIDTVRDKIKTMVQQFKKECEHRTTKSTLYISMPSSSFTAEKQGKSSMLAEQPLHLHNTENQTKREQDFLKLGIKQLSVFTNMKQLV